MRVSMPATEPAAKTGATTPVAPANEKSLVVLPLENLSPIRVGTGEVRERNHHELSLAGDRLLGLGGRRGCLPRSHSL
jgi:hypothetical protein